MKTLQYINFCFLVLLLLLASGCKTINVRGQIVDQNDIETLKNTKLNKAEVVNLIGNPTFISECDPNIWYYIQRTSTTRAWLEPKIISQEIIEIIFNNNIVERVKVINNSNTNITNFPKEYNKTLGTQENSIQKFIKGIGKFNKTKDTKKKKY